MQSLLLLRFVLIAVEFISDKDLIQKECEKKMKVYKIEPIANMGSPLYSKPDDLKNAFEFLGIGVIKKDFRISTVDMDELEYNAMPEHAGF